MKRLIAIIALAAGLGMLCEAQAQKVIKDAGGNVFVDVQDMPVGTFSTTTLNKIHQYADAGNSVYKRLQYSKNDMPTPMSWGEAAGLSIDTPNYNDITANGIAQGQLQTGCVTYSAEGNIGTWRLPTYRELLLIFVMEDGLFRAGATRLTPNRWYYTATEHSPTQAHMSQGQFYFRIFFSKFERTSQYARCVREVN